MTKMLKMVYKLKIHVGGGLICNKTTVDLLGMAGDSKRSFWATLKLVTNCMLLLESLIDILRENLKQ